jgi:serine/threonine protein kinase
MSSAVNAHINDGDAAHHRNIELLSAFLIESGALEFAERILEDYDDDSIVTISKIKPDRIASKYGIPHGIASAFVERCRSQASIQHSSAPASADVSSMLSATATSFGPAPASLAPPLDDTSLLRMLNFEILGELGRGGFGRVYKCKNVADKLIVAVKLVNDPKNASEAVREGQRLRRVKHKNIVLMHKVHDLKSMRMLGTSTCALEMEVVTGGDLFQHLEAARHRPELRLPHDAVLRFARQLLEALVYLHDTMNWIHGDIKPHNILLQCTPIPSDGSAVNYCNADVKLADFGLAKVMYQDELSSSFMLTNASTKEGILKGTMWYLSPEALQCTSSSYNRSYSDDLWSACLVIYEMDTGLSLQQLMTSPGAVKHEELLTKASPELLPVLCSVLLVPDATSRCLSAAELLRTLDASIDPLFTWQFFCSLKRVFVQVHPAASYVLEQAFIAGEPAASLPLKPPLDLNFDILPLLTSTTSLGSQTERKSGDKCQIRRLLKPSALSNGTDIPIWQELVDEKEWLQCSPSMCAKLETGGKDATAVLNASRYRRLLLNPSSIGNTQLPHPLNSEPYLSNASADDVAILSKRVHESLPEWDISEALYVVNPSLASKFAAHRYQLAACCNGNPTERILFHLPAEQVIPKIWQAGEGIESRLSQWAEIGRGAYFCENVIYNYAYKFKLWTKPDKFQVVPEPVIGEKMQLFAVLVCLGKVADLGPGCESCPSPAYIDWKDEFSYQKTDQNPNPLPARPPSILLSTDPAEHQHALDLNQVKSEPRYDSVMSTEGDLATHPASLCRITSGDHMRDVLHPRLKSRASDWARQYVIFETVSYPLFLLTLTKTRQSPMGLQQLIFAGCDAQRVKALGYGAGDVKALGKSVPEMRGAGWELRDLTEAGFDAGSLLAGGFSVSDARDVGLTALQLKDAGCSARLLKNGGFNATELLDVGFDLAALDAADFSFDELHAAGFGYDDLAQVSFCAHQINSHIPTLI